jgi:hypothetical protein
LKKKVGTKPVDDRGIPYAKVAYAEVDDDITTVVDTTPS